MFTEGLHAGLPKVDYFPGSSGAPSCRKGKFAQIGDSQDAAAYLRTKQVERSQKRKGLGDPVEANVIRNKSGINQGHGYLIIKHVFLGFMWSILKWKWQ